MLSTAQQDNRGPNSYIPTSPVVSTESWDRQPAPTAQQQVQQQFLAHQENVPRSSASGLPSNLPQQPQAQFGAPTSWSPRSPQQGQYPTTEPQTLPKEQPRPAPDLLTSTGELLALQPSNAEVPVPPVPPNPEKDFLLQSIGVALYQKRQADAAHTEASVASLSAQYGALKAASSRLQAEEDALKSLSSTLTSNEKILKESMRKAEEVMDDAKTRTVPGVDEILVAPTVVAGQLYELVAEERAINDALFVLSRAHDKRRITSDLFLRVSAIPLPHNSASRAVHILIAVGWAGYTDVGKGKVLEESPHQENCKRARVRGRSHMRESHREQHVLSLY